VQRITAGGGLKNRNCQYGRCISTGKPRVWCCMWSES